MTIPDTSNSVLQSWQENEHGQWSKNWRNKVTGEMFYTAGIWMGTIQIDDSFHCDIEVEAISLTECANQMEAIWQKILAAVTGP